MGKEVTLVSIRTGGERATTILCGCGQPMVAGLSFKGVRCRARRERGQNRLQPISCLRSTLVAPTALCRLFEPAPDSGESGHYEKPVFMIARALWGGRSG